MKKQPARRRRSGEKAAKYTIIELGEHLYEIVDHKTGAHEVIFVTNDRAELQKRWLSFRGNGAIFFRFRTGIDTEIDE
jgi:hypothetical protein